MKEIRLRELQGERRQKFMNAIQKEIQNNLNTGAYEIMTPEDSESARRESPDKILQSRYVLVEKGIEVDDIEKAEQDGILLSNSGDNSTKAKARHVMKGFSEWNAEDLETATPQVAKESMMMVLQIMSSHHWIPWLSGLHTSLPLGRCDREDLVCRVPARGHPKHERAIPATSQIEEDMLWLVGWPLCLVPTFR